MLPASAAERDHQVLKAAALILAYAGIHERLGAAEKPMHAVLLIEVFDDGSIPSGQRLEALFASGIRKAAAIEDESTAVTAFVLGHAVAMKRKTEDAHGERFCS